MLLGTLYQALRSFIIQINNHSFRLFIIHVMLFIAQINCIVCKTQLRT
jgi:hypothetical protein